MGTATCDIERQQAPELRRQADVRPLLFAMVAQAIAALQDWCTDWPRFATMGRDWQRRRLQDAQAADNWLLGEADGLGGEGLTFEQVAVALDVDPERFIERLYATLDSAAVQALWQLPGIPDARGRKRQAVAA